MDSLLGGHFAFGVLTGLLTGMSESAVVSVALPLLFTFAGGSIVALSVAEGVTPEDHALLGGQLLWFSVGAVLGLIVGMLLRKAGAGLPLRKP